MLDRSLFFLTFTAAIGCGLVAGVFFAFSTFIMSALARLKPNQGIAAMQSINITAINPLFMLALFGTAAVCILLVTISLLRWHQASAVYWLAGSLIYLVGTVGVTMAFNVPLNDALAIANPDSAATLWAQYLNHWTAWNHVRMVAALAATALFTLCRQN